MQHYTRVDDIQFYIPPDITVPTGLVLMVDGVRVDYEHYHVTDVFDFYIDTTDKELAMAIAERIVTRIQKEHNDFKHGVTWLSPHWKSRSARLEKSRFRLLLDSQQKCSVMVNGKRGKL